MMIVGLPRSRTAWLSVFMSQSNTYFHHECINGCSSLSEYKEKLSGCGDSTTGFSLLLNCMKDKKVVIIKKNKKELEDCIAWCDSVYGLDSRDYILETNKLLGTIKGLVVNQSDIDSNLNSIWEYLVDDEWSDKYERLTKMNIQTQSHEINKVAAKELYDSLQ
jgi:hypothetical protein